MYHTNLDWCTPSVTPLQKRLMSAFRRDLVVFDCQPPSKIWRKSSPTVAMWLPCRYTLDSSDSGQYVTLVLLFVQLLLLATAAFIRDSILRMKWCRLVDFYTIHEIGGPGHNRVCATSPTVHWSLSTSLYSLASGIRSTKVFSS